MEKNIADRGAEGYQWRTDNDQLRMYNITGIPRVLLINKDFKIGSPEGPLPSNPDAGKAIDALLN